MSGTDRPVTGAKINVFDYATPNTIDTLNRPLIKVVEGPAPKTASFAVPTMSDDTSMVNLGIETYVRLKNLSDDLQQRIATELGIKIQSGVVVPN